MLTPSLAAAGAALCGVFLLLRRSRVPVAARLLTAITAAGVSTSAAVVAVSGLSPARVVAPATDPADAPLPPGSYPDRPLPLGTPLPPLAAAGWLNGQPPTPGGANGPRLVVLDVWAHW